MSIREELIALLEDTDLAARYGNMSTAFLGKRLLKIEQMQGVTNLAMGKQIAALQKIVETVEAENRKINVRLDRAVDAFKELKTQMEGLKQRYYSGTIAPAE